jgi:putative phage-type endonuclease
VNRADWLERRRRGIGGTDAAAILGLSPYRTPLAVWQDKLGLANDVEPTPPMEWGLRLEDTIADAYQSTTGRKVRKAGFRRAKHVRDFPLFATLDRLDADGPVELKSTRSAFDLGDPDGPAHLRVPPHWYVQVQVQMAVTRRPIARVAILVGGSDFRIVDIPVDEDFVDDMMVELGAFWRTNVLGRVMPDVQAGDLAFLATRYPRDSGAEIVGTSEVAMLVREYVEADARRKAADDSMSTLRARIESAMGDASRLVTGVAVVSWKSHERTSVAWKELATVYRNGYRALLNAIDEAHMTDEIAGPPLDLDALESIYTTKSTVRPFRVERREDA